LADDALQLSRPDAQRLRFLFFESGAQIDLADTGNSVIQNRLNHFIADTEFLHVRCSGSAQIVRRPVGDVGHLGETWLELRKSLELPGDPSEHQRIRLAMPYLL